MWYEYIYDPQELKGLQDLSNEGKIHQKVRRFLFIAQIALIALTCHVFSPHSLYKYFTNYTMIL